MKVCLCGEGVGDVGEEAWNARRKENEQLEGWLQPLVRKLLGEETEFLAFQRHEILLLPRQRHRFRPLPRGHGERALAAQLRARQEECDAIIFMADADSPERRVWQGHVSDIETGFRASPDPLPGAPCVPMAASECWMMADGDAWKSLAGAVPKALPRRGLESLSGERDDPEGNHPHRLFKRVCDEAEVPDDRETRWQLARSTDPAVLAAQCRVSWTDFATAVEAMREAAGDDASA